MSLAIQRIPDGEDYWGKMHVVYKDIVLDSSYPAGGYLINAQDVGLKQILEAIEVGGNAASGGLIFTIDQTSALGTSTNVGQPSKSVLLRAFFPSGGGAAAPATLANAAIAAGAVAVTSNAANGASDLTPGIAVEVATGANLSTITLRVRFTGR